MTSVFISPDGRYGLSGSGDETIRLWEFDWRYDFPEPAHWDEGARPNLEKFLALHTPVGSDGISRVGRPEWSEEDFQELLEELSYRGYGWLKEGGVRKKLEKMTKKKRVCGSDCFVGKRESQKSIRLRI